MAGRQDIEAGKAFVRLYLEDGMTKALVRSLRTASEAAHALGASLSRIGAATTAIGAAMTSPFIAGIKAASDMQETMSKFDTVFGDRDSEAKEWGDNFAAQVGRSKQQIAQFLAGSQDLFVPLGFEPGAAETMSKQITELATDLASFNNMQDADTMRDLQAALTGSGEVMKKYGVIVSEAAVKQQMLDDGLDPKNATEQQKVMARLAIIMAGTTAAQGDATRTAGSFANRMKALRASVDDAAVAIGTSLLPVVTPLVDRIVAATNAVAKWIEGNQEAIKIAAGVAAGITVAGTAIVGVGGALIAASVAMSAMATAAGKASSAFTPLVNVNRLVGKTAAAAIAPLRGMASIASGAGVMAVRSLAAPFAALPSLAASSMAAVGGAVSAGFAAARRPVSDFGAQAADRLIAVGASWSASFNRMGEVAKSALTKDFWSGVKTQGVAAMATIRSSVASMASALRSAPSAAVGGWQSLKDAAISSLTNARQRLVGLAATIKASLNRQTLVNVWEQMRAAGSAAMSAMAAQARASLGPAIRTSMQLAWSVSVRTARASFATMLSLGRSAARGIGAAMRSATVGIGRGFSGLAGSLGVLASFGGPLLSGLSTALFVIPAVGAALSALLSPAGLVIAAITGGAVAWVKYSEQGKAALTAVVEAFAPIIETAKITMAGVKDAIASGNWKAAADIAMAGLKVGFLQGLVAIQDATGGGFEKVLRTVGKVADGILEVWDWTTGHLKSMWDKWGAGVLDTMSKVAAAIPGLWQSSVESTANWMLAQSAQGGVVGKVFSSILGVDMADEQAQATAQEQARRAVAKRNLEWTIGEGEKQLAAAQQSGDTQSVEKMTAALDKWRAELAAIPRDGEDLPNVLNDARESVRQYVEQLKQDMLSIGDGDPGTGRASVALDQFLERLSSGEALTEAQNQLDRLRQQNAGATAQEMAVQQAGGQAAQPGQAGAAAANRAQAFGDLTTFSAAAAVSAGFGGQNPQQQMAADIREQKRIAAEQLAIERETLEATRQLQNETMQMRQGLVYA